MAGDRNECCVRLYRTVEFPVLSLTSFPRIFRVRSFEGFHVCVWNCLGSLKLIERLLFAAGDRNA